MSMRKVSYRNIRVPNLSVRILRDVLIGAGLDHLAPFRAAGLDPAIAEYSGSVVTGEQELAFQLTFAELTQGRPDLWVKAGQGYSHTAFGLQGQALATSPTLMHWVKMASENDLTYSMAEYSPLLSGRGALVGLQITYHDSPVELIPFSVHREIVATQRGLAMLTAKDPFPLTAAYLPLEEVSPQLEEVIAAPIILGAPEVRLEWDERLSTEPLPFGDQFQHETYARQAQEYLRNFYLEQDWERSVVKAIKATISTENTLSAVAATLHTSARTLQRRLGQNGTTFKQLRDLARFELAIDLLSETNLPIAEIARRLRYGEHANFTTAFKRWSGRTPSEYRAAPLPRR
jgi:AraC-like DNA-binding protein